MPEIPTTAVEAAFDVRRGYEDPGCDDAIEGYLEAAAPHIAAQANADLLAWIRALRDEWRAVANPTPGYEYAMADCADTLDALLPERAR